LSNANRTKKLVHIGRVISEKNIKIQKFTDDNGSDDGRQVMAIP